MVTTEVTTPRIYVASLSDYNAGRLHGAWIDAAQTAEAIAQDVQDMLAASSESGAEEWAIHDFEGFEGIELSQWESFDKIAELARKVEIHGNAFSGFLALFGTDADPDTFDDLYAGEWDSVEDYAWDLIDAGVLGEIPESLAPYIDVKAFARDLEIGGDICTAEAAGRVYVFRNI